MALYQIFFMSHGHIVGAEFFQSRESAEAYARSEYSHIDWWVEQIQ